MHVRHVAQSTVVQDAWARSQPVMLHGWVYGLSDGLLQDLCVSMRSAEEVEEVHRSACAGVVQRHGLDLS